MSLLSDLLALPAYLFFQATWLTHSLRRPFLLVSALCILSNPPAAIRKCKLFYMTFMYLAFCKDKKWKVPKDKDPASFFPVEYGGYSPPVRSNKYRSKTVIIIRHGESTWNDTFNPGDRNKFVFILFYIPNMIYAIIMETYFFVSGKDDESWFFDSALSAKGVGQGEGLRKFLKKEKMRLGTTLISSSSSGNPEERAVKILLALGEETNPSSHVVASNLRRAISTAAIGLADRFVATSVTKKKGTTTKDNILLLPSMQEISFNPDALTILPPKGVAHPTWCDDTISGLPPGTFSSLVDTRFHTGNKSLDSNGLIRLNQFCADVFDSSKLPKDTVIAAGHSLFFRSFFQVFLPRGLEHISKKKKLVNGGTVMVTFREVTLGNGMKEYMIDPNSIVMVYGGFGKHTKG
ncbi:hypothetical protein ACHAXR_007352 [Thalassiosira sp. AJA248-18]